MAGVTTDSFERFLEAAGLSHLRTLPITELLRGGFTLLGQRESQLAMFRLQLASALQREKELTEALHSKLTADMAAFVVPSAAANPQAERPSIPSPPAVNKASLLDRKSKKRGKKKK